MLKFELNSGELDHPLASSSLAATQTTHVALASSHAFRLNSTLEVPKQAREQPLGYCTLATEAKFFDAR